VVNSRDEERERLRLELKAAQEELNMLREIQRRVSGSNSAALTPVHGRPQSFISDASSYSDTEAIANTEEEDVQGRTSTERCKSRPQVRKFMRMFPKLKLESLPPKSDSYSKVVKSLCGIFRMSMV
jgi:hypothetical protein